MRARVAAAMLGLLGAAAASAQPPRPFVPGSFETLLAARRGAPFILVLWSITCAPCREEFGTLGAIRREHEDLQLVLISTDDIAAAEAAVTLLKHHELDDIEAWMFADSNAQRLRYEIDPAWYGELPRSYLYAADHRRLAISGRLEREHLKQWLRDTARPH